jgi:carboxylesterase type B
MRATFRDAVAAVLRQRAGEWVNWSELSKAGGGMAWRTRTSDARRELGMVIENKVTRRPDGSKDSWYRYLPEKLF